MTTTPRPSARGVLRLLTAVRLAGCVGCLDAPGKSGHAASTTPSATLDGALPISPRPTPVTPSPTVAASSPQYWADTPVAAIDGEAGWHVRDPLKVARDAWLPVLVEHLDPQGEHLEPKESDAWGVRFEWPAEGSEYDARRAAASAYSTFGRMGLMVGGGHPNLLDDGCRYLGTPTPSNGKASCSTERFAGPGGERARISPFSPSAMSAAAADPRLTLPERAYAVPSDRAVVSVVEDHFPRYRADQAFIPPEHPGDAQTWAKLGGLGLSVSVWPAGGTPACGRGGSCLERRVFGTDDPTTVFVGAWDHEDLRDSYPSNSRASQREFVYVGPRHTVVVRESRLVKADEESLGADLDQRLIDFLLDPRLQ